MWDFTDWLRSRADELAGRDRYPSPRRPLPRAVTHPTRHNSRVGRAARPLAEQHTTGGSGGPVSVVEPALYATARRIWVADRPGWVDPAWFDAPIRPAVRRLLHLPLGPQLLTELTALPDGPCPADHSDHTLPGQPPPGSSPGFVCGCQVVTTTAWHALGSWLAARAGQALVQVAGPEPVPSLRDPISDHAPRLRDQVREELAPALRISPLAMASRLTAARSHHTHPQLHALVVQGLISAWTATLILGDLTAMPECVATAIIGELVDKIRSRHCDGDRPWTSGQTRQAATRIRLRLAADHDKEIRATAHNSRTVDYQPQQDGMASLHATLADTDAWRIYRRLTAIAAGDDDPTRSRDQKRADALTDLLLTGITPDNHAPGCQHHTQPPHVGSGSTSTGDSAASDISSGGSVSPHRGADDGAGRGSAGEPPVAGCTCPGRTPAAPQINVVVSLQTLLGLADDPAHLVGIGPMPADTARALAADGRWRAWITDATRAGTVTATGTRSYTPTAELARLVRAREPYCRMLGCRRSAESCDLDHTISWPREATSIQNLGPLCRRHHNLKTHYGFALTNQPDSEPPPDTGLSADTGSDRRPPTGWTWQPPSGIRYDDTPDPPLD